MGISDKSDKLEDNLSRRDIADINAALKTIHPNFTLAVLQTQLDIVSR